MRWAMCLVSIRKENTNMNKLKHLTGPEQVQKLTDKIMKDIDGIAANKEKEVMEV